MKARRWLILAAIAVSALQIGFLVSLIAGRAAILRSGTEVTLSVEPVDPRDLLRGDYVVLGYNISSIPVDLFVDLPSSSFRGQDSAVYVRLRKGDDEVWQPVAARLDEPVAAPLEQGEVDIRGRIDAGWFEGVTEIPVRYGIERFYVPEGEGRAIENDLRVRPFTMSVVVASDGAAQIRAFKDGHKTLFEEPLY